MTSATVRRCDGERWLVTGGSRGLGRALVLAVARAGARVVYCGRSDAGSALEGAGADLAHRLHFVGADVAREDDVERLFDEACRWMGGVDVVVNNAGVAHDALLADTTLEAWSRVMGTNVRGAYFVMRRAVEEFLSGGGGQIVNVASIAAGGIVGQGAYAASKSALISMSRSVAKEYGARNIRCNAIVPGFFDTDMTAGLDRRLRGHIEGLSPENRFGTVDEIVDAILFVTSAEASFVTGDELWVSGGVRDVPRPSAQNT